MNAIIGSSVERIPKVDSTNNYAAIQLLTKRLSEGIVFVATDQFNGRGQTSNKWESEPNMNLTFSILLYPYFLDIRRQFEISKTISLGITDFLIDKTQHVSIKWPNDVYIGKGKIAGILIENTVTVNKVSTSIVGIGMNINQKLFKSDAPNPVSLSQITGEVYNLETVLSDLCLKIDARYQQLIKGEINRIDKDYMEMLYQFGHLSPYSDETGDFVGRILGVDHIGRLLIETDAGDLKKYQYKEVVFK